MSLSTSFFLPPILWFLHSAGFSLLIGTRWRACANTVTTRLRLIPREHYHSTYTVWQAPDDARPLLPGLTWGSSLIWSHFRNLFAGYWGFSTHPPFPHGSSALCSQACTPCTLKLVETLKLNIGMGIHLRVWRRFYENHDNRKSLVLSSHNINLLEKVLVLSF